MSAERNPGSNAPSSIRCPCRSSTFEPAKPPSSASRTFAGSTPALTASTNASPTASTAEAITSWLHALATWPAPAGPTCTIVEPIASNRGSARSNASSGPPTMIESVPASAPTWPPETGASSIETPFSPSRSANDRVAIGSIVLMSITSEPGAAPSAAPSAPSSTRSTSGVSGSIVTITSEARATSAGLEAHEAPSATSASTGGAGRECTGSGNPADSRWRAIGAPMTPRPTNPTRSVTRLGDRLIGDAERLVDDPEALGQLLLGDRQRRVGHDPVEPDHREQPAFVQMLGDRLHLVADAVERRERLHRLPAANQLHDAEQSDVADQPDRRMLVEQLLMVPGHDLAHLRRVLDQAVLLIHADRRDRRGQRQRVRVVGQAAVEHVLVEVLIHLRRQSDRPKRDVRRRQSLGHRHDVGHHAPVVHGEPLPRAAEPGHDLVGDQQDPVPVAELAHALQVAAGWDQDAIGARHGLEDECGDRVRALEGDRLVQVRERRVGVLEPTLRPVVRVEHVH